MRQGVKTSNRAWVVGVVSDAVAKVPQPYRAPALIKSAGAMLRMSDFLVIRDKTLVRMCLFVRDGLVLSLMMIIRMNL